MYNYEPPEMFINFYSKNLNIKYTDELVLFWKTQTFNPKIFFGFGPSLIPRPILHSMHRPTSSFLPCAADWWTPPVRTFLPRCAARSGHRGVELDGKLTPSPPVAVLFKPRRTAPSSSLPSEPQ